MPRFRRYRVFLVSAFIILVLLFQVGRNSNWEPSASLPHSAKGSGGKQETNIRPPKYQPPPGNVKPNGPGDTYRGASPDEPQRQPPKKEQNIEIPVLKEEYGYKDYALPPVTAGAKHMVAKLDKLGKSTSKTAAAKATKVPGSTEDDDDILTCGSWG
jgi:mannosyl-oligosaccharide alpha-1,2-mannosidase